MTFVRNAKIWTSNDVIYVLNNTLKEKKKYRINSETKEHHRRLVNLSGKSSDLL